MIWLAFLLGLMAETIEAKVDRLELLVYALANELAAVKARVDSLPEPISPDEIMCGKYNEDLRIDTGLWIWADTERTPPGEPVLIIRIDRPTTRTLSELERVNGESE